MLVGAQLRSNAEKLVGTLYTRRLLAKFIFFILYDKPGGAAPRSVIGREKGDRQTSWRLR